MKKIKRILLVIALIFFLVGMHFVSRYLINENFIRYYEEEKYDKRPSLLLKLFNYPESYIYYYNEGDYYYQNKEYEKAIVDYTKALSFVPKDKVCYVRHNLALSQLQIIDYDSNKNLKEELLSVQDILLENNCATESGNGIHQPSQDLYDKIEKLLSQSGKGSGDGDDGNQGDDDNDDSRDSDSKKENDIEKELRQQQIEANGERQKINRSNYEYYKGKSW